MAIHYVQSDFIIDVLEKKSHSILQGIFKHSPRCFISRAAMDRLKTAEEIKVDLYVIDVLQSRNLSNEIALHYNIVHHSPQLILVKDGNVIVAETHENVDFSLISSRI